VRLDHLLSRDCEQGPTTDPCSRASMPLTVWGAGSTGEFASYHFSVVEVLTLGL
jgi:hypothetical protein